MEYAQTLRDHRFVDGVIIPKGQVLPVVVHGKDILTVVCEGEKKMLRKSQVVLLQKNEANKNSKLSHRASKSA